MKSAVTPKTILTWFFVVLGLYLLVFYVFEYWRHRRGAWEVDFVSDSGGRPSIVIYQARLNISSVEVLFPDQKTEATNVSKRITFDRPLRKVLFGRVLYEDLTVLPGVVTLDLFGHEIELLPRALIVNKKEVPWKSESVIELWSSNKLAQPPRVAHPDEPR